MFSYFIATMSVSVMGSCDLDARERHFLCAEFSKLLQTLGNLLQQSTNVDNLRTFLRYYCHPMYPEKLYVDPHVYCDAKTPTDIILSLTPTYINFMHPFLLQGIVDKCGNAECRRYYQEYEQKLQMLETKVWHHPAPVTDDEIEQCSRQKKLQVSVDGDIRRTTPQDVRTVQGVIMQATGICRAGLVFAHQNPGNSVILTFLIPDSFLELFHELCDDDLALLTTASITKIRVEEVEIIRIKNHVTKLKRVKVPPSLQVKSKREQVKPGSLDHYLKERQEIPSLQCTELIAMMKSISDIQMNKECTVELLQRFSSYIQDWRTLAPFLGMQEFFYDEFTTTYSKVEDQNFQLLLFWKKREGKNAIYHNLLETIVLHGNAEEIRALIRMPLEGELCVLCVVDDTNSMVVPYIQIL